jgi:hypothetical protein
MRFRRSCTAARIDAATSRDGAPAGRDGDRYVGVGVQRSVSITVLNDALRAILKGGRDVRAKG